MENSESIYKEFLQFKLANRFFLLDLRNIEQVIKLPVIYNIPVDEPQICGLINYNSKIIPAININEKLELPDTSITPKSRIIIVSHKDELLGIIIDEVVKYIKLDNDRVNELQTFDNISNTSNFLDLESIL